jgi:hypothetical protein
VDSTYVLTAEVVVSEIASGGAFTVVFDTPQVRSVSFISDGFVKATPGGIIGTFNFGEKIDLRVEIDLTTDRWNIFLGEVLFHSGDSWDTAQINAIRVTTDVLSPPDGSRAAIDNLVVTVSSAPITGG